MRRYRRAGADAFTWSITDTTVPIDTRSARSATGVVVRSRRGVMRVGRNRVRAVEWSTGDGG